MNKQFTILTLSMLILFLNSCGTIMPGKTKTSVKKNAYSEDLTAYRPELAVENLVPEDTVREETIADSTSAAVTEKLNIVLDTAATYAHSTIKYIDGFTIQVYGGDNRADAKDYRLDLIRNFPASEPRMVFEQPNYKVRVGKYYTRLEAQHFYSKVKHVFPRAILIPTRIYID